jgi:YesN/AraC family two-component response regulator
MAETVKVLFVDDEPAIRLSLPAILKMHGFNVTSASSVSEALQEISHKNFDVLISDLNIGNPGDGFTVVSAMRRTQPSCVTLILTGFPAFETALQAIRSQVDDYLIKPAGADKLINAIEQHLVSRRPHLLVPLQRMNRILRENADKIADEILHSERCILQLPRVHLSEQECRDNARAFVLALAGQLELGKSELSQELTELSIRHGRARYEQGYSAPMLVEENRMLCSSILDCVQQNLLCADVSNLVPDLKLMMSVLAAMLREAISSFSSDARVA